MNHRVWVALSISTVMHLSVILYSRQESHANVVAQPPLANLEWVQLIETAPVLAGAALAASAAPEVAKPNQAPHNAPIDLASVPLPAIPQDWLDHPDAPVPGGTLHLRVWLVVDDSGDVQDLQAPTTNNAQAPFLAVVMQSLPALGKAALTSGLSASHAHCLELEFTETEIRVGLNWLPGRPSAAACLGSAPNLASL